MKKFISQLLILAVLVILLMYVVNKSAPSSDARFSKAYSNRTGDFFIRIPDGYTVDDSYMTQTDRGVKIYGVKLSIPSSFATGTNLSADTHISFESLPQQTPCSADLFLDKAYRPAVSEKTENGIHFSVATTSDAAAGNRYDLSIYAFNARNSCMAVRYFIHYGAIQNYEPGAVKEFNKKALVAEFDAIRNTLRLND